MFLEIRPSPIVNGKPTVTDKTVAKQFNDFFKACYDQLKNAPVEWPTTWTMRRSGPGTFPTRTSRIPTPGPGNRR